MNSQTRNLNPTPEARFAMFHWHKEYASQHGGSMDFYDALSADDKRYCAIAVREITAALTTPSKKVARGKKITKR